MDTNKIMDDLALHIAPKVEKQSTVEERFMEIVDGIDKDEVEYNEGWWETSTGAEFGSKKKQELWDLIKIAEQKAREEGFKEGFLDGQVYQNNLRRVDLSIK